MADTSQQELSEPHTNGVVDGLTEEEKSKMRPADIDADMREMERRKRVELIMNSKMFKEELERIIETQLKDGSGPSGLLQQISDMMGAQGARFNANVFKNSNCVVPINDIRGVEAKGYERGEKVLRCKLAAVFRLLDLYGWTQGVGGQITARLNQDQEHFLVNPYGLLYHEVTASSLMKVDMQGQVVEQGTTNFSVHVAGFQLHSTIHAARPDIKCIIHITTPTVTAVSSLKGGLLPLSPESVVIGDVSTHQYIGEIVEPEEREKIARNLGPINKVMLLTNRGALCCGETVEEAFYNVYNTVLACETQLKLMPIGLDNLNLLTEESRKAIFESSRKPPAPLSSAIIEPSPLAEKLEKRWRIGGTEFEALMRMLDNAGFRTGYIYRHPLIKSEPPRPRNDVEVPPAVSSLGYLLEEEELYKQGLWKGGRKGADRSRWLNSPNVYQKVEILETGTPDPKKITKWVDQNAEEWVSDGSPTHSSTPVRIDSALQFVPKNTNPKEFKQLQQQIKDYRRSEKISAGPQSHILEGVSWEEAKKMQDATISGTGEQVVLVGAASKGIIQRGFQHNAMVYKTPYAKNPFDAVTDQELDQYKKEVERKTKGDIYDESQSESEALSSFNISRATHESSTAKSPIQSPISVTSETEEESRDEPRVLRIEKKHVPVPSQAEVVLSDGKMYVHDNVKTANSNIAVTVTAPPPSAQQPLIQIKPDSALLINHHKIGADATTEFLNEMRRNAIDSRNDRKQDESGDDSSEMKMQEYAWWRVKTYEEPGLEVVKTGTTAVPMNPIRLTIPFKHYQTNNRKEVSSKLPLSPRMLERQYFFDQYDKIYNAYMRGSHNNLDLIFNMPIRKNTNTFIKEPNRNNNINNRFASNDGTVKHLIAKYSYIDTKECKQSIHNRKRDHLSSTLSPNYPKLSLPKVPRMTLSHARKLEDLESPRLVEAAINNKTLRTYSRKKNILDNEYFLAQPTMKIENKIVPIEETPEIINTEDINGNINNNKETTKSYDNIRKIETPDENGNPLTSSDDIKNPSNLSDPKEVNQEINDTKATTTTESPERDQSSAEDIVSQQTVVERGAIAKDLSFGKDSKEATSLIEDDEKWLNESVEEMESSFHREINESQPWRYSSPIKHYQREDSMTEVINSINVNLTPSKSLSIHSFHLPNTPVSIKYNLNSNSMSTIYRLTPTTIDEDDMNKEHITCGKECPQCLILDDSVELENLSPDDIPDEFSPFKWDEPFVEKTNENQKEVIDLNKTIDLFDNSIEMDTEPEEDVCIKEEPCSLEESDLLELPHSTVAELKESDEITFHEDITTSVNEIIAGLGEREALLKAADIVDDVISVACSNLEEKSAQACNVEVQQEIQQENQEEKDEVCEIIHKITQEPVEQSNNSDLKEKKEKFIVIDELIHHVIDKNTSRGSNSTSESSTTESFNIKKVKESVNIELKEMQSNLSKDRNIETSIEGDSNDQEISDINTSYTLDLISNIKQIINDIIDSLGSDYSPENTFAKENLNDQEISVIDGGDTEKLINDMKQIIDGIGTSTPKKAVIRDKFEQQLLTDNFDVYQNQPKLITKQSTGNSDNESNDNFCDSLNSNHSPKNMIVINYSDAVQQFKEECEKILNDEIDKSQDAYNTTFNLNETSVEGNSNDQEHLEVNRSYTLDLISNIKEVIDDIIDSLDSDHSPENTFVEENLNDQEISDIDGGDTEKLINDMKQIIDGIDTNAPNEAVIRDEFFSIVDYLDEQQLHTDNSEVYQNQLKLIIKQSTGNLDNESNDNFCDSLNSNHSPENMIVVNYSDVAQQFKEECERILNDETDKSQDACDTILILNEENPSHTEASEISSTEVNVSFEKEAIEEYELTDTISITDNDTKSDNSKEQVEPVKKINFCLIEYEGKHDKSGISEEDSEDTISDVVEKDITQMWNKNETEIERNCNEIRSYEMDGSFIEFESVDDVVSNDNIKMACESLISTKHIPLFSKMNIESKPVLSAITEEAEFIGEKIKTEVIIDYSKFTLPAIDEAEELTEKEDIFIPPLSEITMPVEEMEDTKNEQEADDLVKEVENTELVHTATVIEDDKCEESSNKLQEDEHFRGVQMSEYFNDEYDNPIQQNSLMKQENLNNENVIILEETESEAIASLLQILIEEEIPNIIEKSIDQNNLNNGSAIILEETESEAIASLLLISIEEETLNIIEKSVDKTNLNNESVIILEETESEAIAGLLRILIEEEIPNIIEKSVDQNNLNNESVIILEETESKAIASFSQILIEEETPKIIENVTESVLIIESDPLEVKTIEVINIDSDKDESIGMSSMTTNFYSCHDTSISMQDNSTNDLTNYKNDEEDDLESKYSTVNSEDTYTLSDYNSETERDITYSADISSNLRKSDSFSTCDLNPCDTTFNMGDVSSAYENVDRPKNSEEPELKQCSVCMKYFKDDKEVYNRNSMNYEVQKQIENNEVSYASLDVNPLDEVCGNCIMTYSMDTRDFIRLERNVIGEELHYDKLKASPLQTPPKYEDTTLCQIVAKISLTDSLSSNSNNDSLSSVVNIEK